MMRKDREIYINDKRKRIEEISITNSTKDLYQGIKVLTNQFKPSIDIIKDTIGIILCEDEEVKGRSVRYCTDLYQKNRNIVIP